MVGGGGLLLKPTFENNHTIPILVLTPSITRDNVFIHRVCLIEPKEVNTGLWDGMKQDMESLANDETASDVDRRQLRITLARSQEGAALTVNDVIDAVMTNCLDVDEPVLRHLIAGETNDLIQQTALDLTGEAGIDALGFKNLRDHSDNSK